VCCAVWSADGSRLLLGSGFPLPGQSENEPSTGAAVAIVDTATWKVVDHRSMDRVPDVMALSPDGRFLAMAALHSADIEVLDAETLDLRRRVDIGVNDSLWSLSFSRDGRRLAAGGENGNLYVVDTDTWQASEPVLVHDQHLLQVEWLSNNRTVASTGLDGKVVLFDADHAVIRPGSLPALVGSAEAYGHLVPDPVDEIVALNDQLPGLRYPMAPAEWLRETCGIARRDLTRAEWDRYLPGREYRPTCSDQQ
jgi:WD40 repeat protein